MNKLKPRTQLGNFVVDDMISDKGGMSRIYRAHSIGFPEQIVAIKVGLTQGNRASAYKDLLIQESKILSKLHHPGIVRIIPQKFGRTASYNAMDGNGAPYYVMEYISGQTLEQYVKRIAVRFPFKWAVELFYQIVLGVHYMHMKGYAHCDLKPQNIILRQEPEVHEMPQPVLIDFGTVSSLGVMSELAVSPRYAAPEVWWARERPDLMEYKDIQAEKVDIWGLGVILFEIVTGEPLFNKRKENDIKTDILQGKLQRIKNHRKNVDDSIERLMVQMLKSDPIQRPNIRQIIEALDERIASVRSPRIAVKL